jgi:diguanylate cyclase (GGDEF)-like protein/PAS domain S-box-containing protein
MPGSLRCLLVEDSEEDAELISRELKRTFAPLDLLRVQKLGDLQAALRDRKWDVVVSDYGLPGFTGMHALRLVKNADPDLPFILVTGTIGEEAAVEALRAGVDEYVIKGNLRRLASCVSRQLEVASERDARRRADESLRESEERFRQLAENIDVFFYLTDPQNAQTFYASPSYESIFGRTVESLYATPSSWRDAIFPADREVITARWNKLQTEPSELRYRVVRPDGTVRWVRGRAFPVRDKSGKVCRIAGIVEDETERRLADDRIRRLNRVYAVLSGINSLIVRASGREELFREACRIAVEAGRFRMAWLGTYDPKSMEVTPVAHHGHEDGFLRFATLSIRNPEPEGGGLIRRAVREKQPVVMNDMGLDTKFALRRQAFERGYRSGAVLPLIVADEVIGVFGLFADEAEFFDDEEMRLLLELAGDIAFALKHIETSEKLNYLAYYDGVTGVANRTLFLERLSQYIHSARETRSKFAVIVCDLERFRAVNDSFGRSAGDLLLTRFAERLVKCVPDPAQISRLGADHFAIALPEAGNEFLAARLVGDLAKRCLDESFEIAGHELRLSAKAGIALYPDHGSDADTLLRNADAAVKACKKTGERLLFFEQTMTARVAEKLSLETRLRRALERDEFVLHYQPKVDFENRRILGVEALIRWQTEAGLVPPAKFIALLEETGLILEVGAWALRRAVLQHREWIDQGIQAPRIAVNISTVQLRQKDFVSRVKRVLELGASPPGVELEITESMIMDDVAGTIEKLRAIRNMDVSVAVDDFGTGYSSLGYLAKLPVTSLKIDRSFVITMLSDPNAMTLVSTIISLAHSLKLKVVAEGVDAEDQARTLHLLRCDEMQGYLFSKPVPAPDLVRLLVTQRGSTAGALTHDE